MRNKLRYKIKGDRVRHNKNKIFFKHRNHKQTPEFYNIFHPYDGYNIYLIRRIISFIYRKTAFTKY